jgi:hypothetical protein
MVVSLVAYGLPLPGLDAPTLRCPRNRVNSSAIDEEVAGTGDDYFIDVEIYSGIL